MKRIAAFLSLLPVFAMATSPILNEEVADNLYTLTVSHVGNEGKVLKTAGQHPYTEYLISIPVQVNTGSACTQFVGQEYTRNEKGNQAILRAVGATSPVMDACIAVMPMPVSTQLTFNLRVLTGGFVPAQRYQSQLVTIQESGTYKVTLDTDTDRVTIRRAVR